MTCKLTGLVHLAREQHALTQQTQAQESYAPQFKFHLPAVNQFAAKLNLVKGGKMQMWFSTKPSSSEKPPVNSVFGALQPQPKTIHLFLDGRAKLTHRLKSNYCHEITADQRTNHSAHLFDYIITGVFWCILRGRLLPIELGEDEIQAKVSLLCDLNCSQRSYWLIFQV